MRKDERAAPQFNSLSERLRYTTRDLTTRIGQEGVRLGLSPDGITLLGLVLVVVAALLTAFGLFFFAGLVLILGALLDAVDGAIARAMNRQNRFGALLDSTLDRYADGFMFFAFAYFYAVRGDTLWMSVAIFALIGAYVVSYVRARAEGLGIRSIKEGWFDRLVRTVVLVVMLLTGLIVPGLVILAVGNHVTAIQRILVVWRTTRDDPTA
ncbi:MAG TPA: CDP-alcohol phosphatidyltransferase family protein [Aggregatilineales bacterium]|nr:CDP-alcohol phosphatidyltransferase family protein [Aggregatilineales bacterium]